MKAYCKSQIFTSALYSSVVATTLDNSLIFNPCAILWSYCSFINPLKYFFHLSITLLTATNTLPSQSLFTLTCWMSFPSQSLCLANLYRSVSLFTTNLAYTPAPPLSTIKSPYQQSFLTTHQVHSDHLICSSPVIWEYLPTTQSLFQLLQ